MRNPGRAAGFTKWPGYFRSTTFRKTMSDSLTTSARSLAFSSMSDSRSVSSTSSQAASSRTGDALEQCFRLVAGYAFLMTDIPGTNSPPAKLHEEIRLSPRQNLDGSKGKQQHRCSELRAGIEEHKDEDLLRSLFIVRPGRVR